LIFYKLFIIIRIIYFKTQFLMEYFFISYFFFI